MKVFLWELSRKQANDYFGQLILWDGLYTYWGEHMQASGGYKKMRSKFCPLTRSRFVYIGEL